ncbi:unnamed protein product [Closterium sp. NIES-53]
MDTEMASWKSTGTNVDEVPPPGPNIVSCMWIFRVKRPTGSPPVFKARYVALGFSQLQGVDFFHTFSPTPKMTTLRVLLHIAAEREYKLHSLDFSTAFLQGSLHEEIWLRCPPGFNGRFLLAPSGASAKHPVLQRFGFTYSSPQSTPLPTGHSLSAPSSEESIEPSGSYPELLGCLISSCEAEIYAGAMATQELRWLTYLLTDLGERPRSPPVLYVNNKAMIALCQEHRLEHRTKHIALRNFLPSRLLRGRLSCRRSLHRLHQSRLHLLCLLLPHRRRLHSHADLLDVTSATGDALGRCHDDAPLLPSSPLADDVSRSATRGRARGARKRGWWTTSASSSASSPTLASRGSIAVEESVGRLACVRFDADFHTSNNIVS